MWTKICANTNLEDALLAASLSADALGFVFATSKRQVTAPQVAAISAHLPDSVERIGVFQTGDAAAIGAIIREAGLTGAQLHGAPDPDLALGLRDRFGGGLRIVQTVHYRVNATSHPGDPTPGSPDLCRQIERLMSAGAADCILMDSQVGSGSGGTGVPFCWSDAARLLAPFGEDLKLIVAGGLRPENVTAAIGALKPWGVDVATGVEAAPGRKSPEKLAAFLKNSRM